MSGVNKTYQWQQRRIAIQKSHAAAALRIEALSKIISDELAAKGLEHKQVSDCISTKLLGMKKDKNLQIYDWPKDLLQKFSSNLESMFRSILKETIFSKPLANLPPHFYLAILTVYSHLERERYTQEIQQLSSEHLRLSQEQQEGPSNKRMRPTLN